MGCKKAPCGLSRSALPPTREGYAGHPWTGLVKNRRKNGDHYWVRANVTPIMEGGKPRAYMSVRTKPSAAEISAAEALYAQMRSEAASGASSFYLDSGNVRYRGVRGW